MKIITALKENKNDFRKKVVIAVGVTVVAVAAGVVLTKMASDHEKAALVVLESTGEILDSTTE